MCLPGCSEQCAGDRGPQSSEQATHFACEKAIPCRTRSWRPRVPAAGARNLKSAQSGWERVQKVFWTRGAKVSQDTTKTRFCTATLFCTSARRLWRPWPKRPFAPSLLTTLGTFEVSGPCSRHSPCPSFPWCFCFLGVFLAAEVLGLLGCFLLIFQGFLGFAG